ncbi:uncharacterized protein LOC143180108 [Calliopsis andreniformis]|uniref:uncharacterized protein LOC143180108 n=1 Tax=Calliopsis andreniformis TaxID=337506 RepID=UPI003FCC324B
MNSAAQGQNPKGDDLRWGSNFASIRAKKDSLPSERVVTAKVACSVRRNSSEEAARVVHSPERIFLNSFQLDFLYVQQSDTPPRKHTHGRGLRDRGRVSRGQHEPNVSSRNNIFVSLSRDPCSVCLTKYTPKREKVRRRIITAESDFIQPDSLVELETRSLANPTADVSKVSRQRLPWELLSMETYYISSALWYLMTLEWEKGTDPGRKKIGLEYICEESKKWVRRGVEIVEEGGRPICPAQWKRCCCGLDLITRGCLCQGLQRQREAREDALSEIDVLKWYAKLIYSDRFQGFLEMTHMDSALILSAETRGASQDGMIRVPRETKQFSDSSASVKTNGVAEQRICTLYTHQSFHKVRRFEEATALKAGKLEQKMWQPRKNGVTPLNMKNRNTDINISLRNSCYVRAMSKYCNVLSRAKRVILEADAFGSVSDVIACIYLICQYRTTYKYCNRWIPQYFLFSKKGKMDTWVTLAAGALILLIIYFLNQYTYWKRHGIPTAKGCLPVVGHMLPIINAKLNHGCLITKFYQENEASMVGFYALWKPVLLVREPSLVKTVLQSNFSSFHQNAIDVTPEIDPIVCKNPFLCVGEEWMASRKRLTYAFSSMRLKILFTTVTRVCKKFTDFLNKRLESSDKYEVELKYLFSKFTGEVVANAGLGIEGHCFDDNPSGTSFDRIGDKMFKPSYFANMMLNVLLFLPALNKILKIPFIPRSMDKFFREIVRESMEMRKKETTPRNDFFQLMMDLEKAEGKAIDMDTLTAHALSFYVDGFETSSMTMTFLGLHLAQYQHIQEKLREEVQTTINKHGGELTYEALKEMTYMDQVISESQRHSALVGTMRKRCTEEFVLEGSDGLKLHVKPGQEIDISTPGLHMDPKYWLNPEEFDPERFTPERKQNIEKISFLPFGEGPRICVGMRMALLQIKSCMATLLRSYKLELSPKTKLPIKISPIYFIASPLGGVWVNISKLFYVESGAIIHYHYPCSFRVIDFNTYYYAKFAISYLQFFLPSLCKLEVLFYMVTKGQHLCCLLQSCKHIQRNSLNFQDFKTTELTTVKINVIGKYVLLLHNYAIFKFFFSYLSFPMIPPIVGRKFVSNTKHITNIHHTKLTNKRSRLFKRVKCKSVFLVSLYVHITALSVRVHTECIDRTNLRNDKMLGNNSDKNEQHRDQIHTFERFQITQRHKSIIKTRTIFNYKCKTKYKYRTSPSKMIAVYILFLCSISKTFVNNKKMACACLTLIAGVVVLLIFYLVKKYTYWRRRGIPTVEGIVPLLGHALPVLTLKKHYAVLLQNVYNKFRNHSMVGLYKITSPILVIRDPRLVKTVMQSNFSSFHENAPRVLKKKDPLLALNPFFTYDDVWMTGRKRLTYAFSNMRLKILFTAVSGVCKKFEDFLNRRLKSNNRYEVELKYLFSKFTGEVVANAGFGIEGHCFEDESHPMAFDNIGHDIFMQDNLAGLILNITFYFSQLNKICRFKFLHQNIDKFFRQIVKENIEQRQKSSTPRNDFLQLMIDLDKAEGKGLDIESITAHAVSFYFDGFETSSIVLTFIGYNLAVHQDVQQKLREEVQSTINKHGGELTFEALKEMTYMDQVISESQRLFPALGVLSKNCTEEFELQGSDGMQVRVKPGTEIAIPLYGLHKDPEYWHDPEVFDPERFSPERKQSIEKMAFLPFGEGPRICVGMRMALLQMKACLTTLIRNYKLELSPKTKIPIQILPDHILTTAVGGVWIYITKL